MQTDVHRNATVKSSLSSFGNVARQVRYPPDEDQLGELSAERQSDPLGLTVVHDPDSDPTVNIIFVHGLGGTSRKTWSRNRDVRLFWPGEWLPRENGLDRARILSFGYNAHFSAPGQQNMLNIGDFATDLLFNMKFGIDKKGQEYQLGKVRFFYLISDIDNRSLYYRARLLTCNLEALHSNQQSIANG